MLAIAYQVAYEATVIWENWYGTAIPALLLSQNASGQVTSTTNEVAKAGIRAGDKLISIDSKRNTAERILTAVLKSKRVGDRLQLTVFSKTAHAVRNVSVRVEPDIPERPGTAD